MSIHLEIALPPDPLTTHGSLRVKVKLRNDGARTLYIPGLFDLTDALTFVIRDPLGNVVRRLQGYTHQAMMVGQPKPNRASAFEAFAPGETWEREIDLCSYQYPLAAGDYELEALYEHRPEAVDARSNVVALSVSDPGLRSLRIGQDNCILEGLWLLLVAGEGPVERAFLRLHNYGRPLGAWFTRELPAALPTDELQVATNAFFGFESYDPFFERWVVARRGAELSAARFTHGLPVGRPRRGTLPDAPGELVGAFWDGKERLLAALAAPGGSLRIVRLEDDAVVPVFTHGSSFHLGRPTAIAGDGEHLHLVSQGRELTYERLDWTGASVERRVLATRRLRPFSCRIDPSTRTVKALYWDGPGGRTLDLVVAGIDDDRLEVRRIDGLRLRSDLAELDFDRDPGGRFLLLVATTDGKLYHFIDDSGPWLLARGEPRYWPRVVAEGRAYLGYHLSGRGYRFVQFNPHRHGRHALDPCRGPDPLAAIAPEIELDEDDLPEDVLAETELDHDLLASLVSSTDDADKIEDDDELDDDDDDELDDEDDDDDELDGGDGGDGGGDEDGS